MDKLIDNVGPTQKINGDKKTMYTYEFVARACMNVLYTCIHICVHTYTHIQTHTYIANNDDIDSISEFSRIMMGCV